MGAMTAARTEDRGSFTHGLCLACGWRGPGRRARAGAERDAMAHADGNCPMDAAELDEATFAGLGLSGEGADGGSQAHGIPVALGEAGVAPGRERLTAHGRS